MKDEGKMLVSPRSYERLLNSEIYRPRQTQSLKFLSKIGKKFLLIKKQIITPSKDFTII